MKDTDTFDFANSNMVNMRNKTIKPIQWIGLYLCILIYIVCMVMIIWLSSDSDSLYLYLNGITIYKSIISGMIAQLQVLVSVFLVLHPMKRGFLVAVLLNLCEAAGAFRSAFFKGNMNALPGIVIPICSIFIITIISWYSKRLNKQIHHVIQNNTIIQENEILLKQLAYYDTLTGLPNRKMMIDEIDKLSAVYKKEKRQFTFVYLDLDDFKKINDTAGHSAGDVILTRVSQRWKNLIHEEDILGRLGGDEFGLLICRKMEEPELKEYVGLFQSSLKESFLFERKEFFISASFGIVKYPEDGSDSTELLKNADIAMNKAKAAGKNEIRLFSYEMQGEILKRLQLENGLLMSIRNNELYMVFQPMYHCGTKKLRGFEALLRWNYPGMGLISPAQFIPIAEETGLIIDIGRWIIRTVLKKFIEYQKNFHISTLVSINISVVQLIEPSFVSMIKEILEETGFDSRYLEFEITESVMISYPEHTIEVIKQLRELGIRISLDDFGTGYASLSHLQLLPINVLKIDKSFIDKINGQTSMNQIVGNIISLAHQLGMEVVAEGVELEEQLTYLAEQNCDYIQGFLLSKPLEETQLVKKLKNSF